VFLLVPIERVRDVLMRDRGPILIMAVWVIANGMALWPFGQAPAGP